MNALDFATSKYLRRARITAWRATEGRYFDDAPSANGVEITDLKIEIEVKLTDKKEPNTCELTIYNLAQTTRDFLTESPLIVRVEAGHANDALHHVFVGDLRFGDSELDGTEWVTTLKIADGDRVYRQARINQSFVAGTTYLDALRKVAETMQLSLPVMLQNDVALRAQYAGGASFATQAQEALTQILNPLGYTWSLQQGRLQILKYDQVTQNQAVEISAATGMIGSPQMKYPEKQPKRGKKKVAELSVTTLFDARLKPGGKVYVVSRHHTGLFKIKTVKHKLNTHDGDFSSEIEAVAL